MAKTRKAWRWAAALSAAALALALVTSAFAQAPPSPPHQFFGSTATGTGALLDGEPAADGATVTASNADTGDAVGTDTINEWHLADPGGRRTRRTVWSSASTAARRAAPSRS